MGPRTADTIAAVVALDEEARRCAQALEGARAA
jgi:hypothetical protein